MPREERKPPVDVPCKRCGGTRFVALTFRDGQTGFDQAGFKCADCGLRVISLSDQRTPRHI